MKESTSSVIKKKIRIGFFGTPYLASRILEDLLSDPDFEVAFAVTNPDKPIGRSWVLQPTPVKEIALENNISIYTPTKIRENREFFEQLWAHNCDYFIVVAYGRILPLEILQLPKKLCINVHGSILPKYRGASPIQAALLAGEKETGVTIMKMSEGMDEGDILKMRTIPIAIMETSETLFQKFADISGPTLIQTLRELEMWGITSLPQEHTLATYCKKIEKEDGLIDWSKSAEEIYHMWQAYTPWPGIYTMYEGKRLLLESVSVILGLSQDPETNNESSISGFLYRKGITPFSRRPSQEWQSQGKVIKLDDGRIWVICGQWILTLEQVKLEWKKSQSIKDFVNGNQKFIGFVMP